MVISKTTKLYYEDPFLAYCEATIVDVLDKGIICDRTVAFAEAGGQEGDTGVLIIKNLENVETIIPFTNTINGSGRVLLLQDFPTIQVDTPIYHVVDQIHLQFLKPGMKIVIKIDVRRRANITVNHTGVHLVLMGIQNLRPGIYKSIKGAHITEDHARLDFYAPDRFSLKELENITDFVDHIVDNDEPILSNRHPEEMEAWYWKCRNAIYPCGGTHLTSTGCVGHVIIRRKNMGKNLERIIANFPNAKPPINLYRNVAVVGQT